MPIEKEKAYGCIFCLTGKEEAVAERINRCCPEVCARAVYQEKHKSVNGIKSREKVILLPGYVFFEAIADDDVWSSIPRADVIRILHNDNNWQLRGNDLQFAKYIFACDGLIGFSKAYREGDHIIIQSGPLKDMEGLITRIDRRGRSGQVALKINGREILVWLGFELVDKPSIDKMEGSV